MPLVLDDATLAALLRRAVYEGVRDALGSMQNRTLDEGDIEMLVSCIVARVLPLVRKNAGVKRRDEPTTYIYALLDPGTDRIRYIGKANDPEDRLAQHIGHAWYNHETWNDTPKEEWIRSLRRENKEPDMKVLEEVPRWESWRWERKWIQWAIDQGFDLTNTGWPS